MIIGMVCSAGSQLAQDSSGYQEWKSARCWMELMDGVLDRKGSLFMTNGCDRVLNGALLPAV